MFEFFYCNVQKPQIDTTDMTKWTVCTLLTTTCRKDGLHFELMYSSLGIWIGCLRLKIFFVFSSSCLFVLVASILALYVTFGH